MWVVLVWLLLIGTAEAGKGMGETQVYERPIGFDQRLYYVASGDGAGQIEYQCLADPGTASSTSRWQIRRFTYNSSNTIATIGWAGTSAGLNSDAFDKVCDSRTTYNYAN
jgi:hypothetical protein